jgi:aminocarboxymuconate-semialdehyde decarboxylase
MPIIDTHTHTIPRFFLDRVASEELFGVRLMDGDVLHPDGDRYPVGSEFYDPVARIAEMDRFGIDISVLSASPTLFFYGEAEAEAADFARQFNDELAAWVKTYPDRFMGLASLPLQSPETAASELERAVTGLGLVGGEIGTSLPGPAAIDEAGLEPLFETAEALDVPLLLHPNDPPVPLLGAFHLPNGIGNPLDTTIAAARLMFSGTLDRYPTLRIILVHGGGFLPYQFGRLDRIHQMRSEAQTRMSNAPSTYMRRFWIDSVTHSTAALEYLARLMGTDRVVLGSDYPFDMQDPDPVGRLRTAGIDPLVLGVTAQELFARSPAAPRQDD